MEEIKSSAAPHWRITKLVDQCLDLLGVLYYTLGTASRQGDISLESHVEHPDKSTIFGSGMIHRDEIIFICDTLRLMTLGTNAKDIIQPLMENELAGRFRFRPWRRARHRAIKDTFVAYLDGRHPYIAAELARWGFPRWMRPTFQELECKISKIMLPPQIDQGVATDADMTSSFDAGVNSEETASLMDEWKHFENEESGVPS